MCGVVELLLVDVWRCGGVVSGRCVACVACGGVVIGRCMTLWWRCYW